MRTSSTLADVSSAALALLLACWFVPGVSQAQTRQELAQQRRALIQQQRQLRQQQRQVEQQQRQNGFVPGGNSGTHSQNQNGLAPRAIDRLRDMPPERQEKFLQNNQRFQALPPNQQAQIRQRLQTWNRLRPEQQQELREREQVWERLTPEQRRNVQQNLLPRWQQLPPDRRQAILQRLHSLRDLSETERENKLNDPNFVGGLSTEDRDTLTQLAHLHVGISPDGPGL
jgi:Protein of unknown function (DUF3106)